jgi:F0F1-type ATP synthase alpha subunit
LISTKELKQVPDILQNIFESVYEFVKNIAVAQLGSTHYEEYLPFITTIFFFVLGSNSACVLIPWKILQIPDNQIITRTNYVGIVLQVGDGIHKIYGLENVAEKLKLELAQFAELEAFQQFSSDLDKVTLQQLARGLRLRELLKQPQNSPKSVEVQIGSIYARTNGYLDKLPIKLFGAFASQLQSKNIKKNSQYFTELKREQKLTPMIEKLLFELIELAKFAVQKIT